MSKEKTYWEVLARPYDPENETEEEYWGRMEMLKDKPVGEKPINPLIDIARYSFMDKKERKSLPSINRWRIRWAVIFGWLMVLAPIALIAMFVAAVAAYNMGEL